MQKSVFQPIALICLLAIATGAAAQINAPQPSPLSTVKQTVGLTDVAIEYSRPSAKGRTIFGELVVFGEMWRTGANASTKITFADDVEIKGTKLPKGTYALYTIPNEGEWVVIFHKNLNHWGTGGKDYKIEEDALRTEVAPQALSPKAETFTMNIGNISNNGADIELMWDNTKISIPFTVDTDTKVMADIKAKLAGPSANTYYQAARYYYDAKKDMTLALNWVNTSIELGGEKYWIVRLKALIQAELKDYNGAVLTAQRSMELAKEANNADYVRMNEKSIGEWKTMSSDGKKKK